jgi:hypothetical protein
MGTHTPGPWIVDVDKQGGDWVYNVRTAAPHNPAGGAGKHIAVCNKQMQARGEDNASLVAAAPDLLAACEAATKLHGFVESLERKVDDDCAQILRAADAILEQLRAAIAKARGTT